MQLQIGEWSADPETNEISRGNEAAHLEPKAMDVLMLLADHVGRVVSREALFAAVWPGVVVGDETLTQSIIKLRRALGDHSRSPSYIETISKRGYRLIAPVRRSDDCQAVAATAMDPPSPRPGPAQSRRYALWSGSIAGLALAFVFVGDRAAPDVRYLHAWMPATEVGDERPSAWITVTVAPFEFLGTDRRQAYLARGISEKLMTDLSRLSALRLIRETDAASAGPAAQGGARYRISGTVQRDSEVLRISVDLVDTTTGEELWSDGLERPYSDLFSVQDEMIGHLVAVLPGKVSDLDRQRLAKRYTSSLQAYDDFLRAQTLFLVRRSEENEEARALYWKAIALDPAFARAYAGVALTYALEYRLRDSNAALPVLDRAFELAETARQIDPDIPEVYWALAFVHAQGRRHELAIASLQRAIALDHSYADAYALLGGIQTYTGHPAQAIPLLRTAMRLNPGGGHLYFLLLGRAYLFENDIEQALINLRTAALRNPVDVETHVYLAAALAASGDPSAAKW
ncbi:MAG: winged helix-turn-helix domain-containing protein, partial [Casimicrobiaceae bacterium]